MASGARVMLIHDEPSRLGTLWMRTCINSRRSPFCFSQKSSAYFFAGSALSWKTTLGNQPYTGSPRTSRTSSSTKSSRSPVRGSVNGNTSPVLRAAMTSLTAAVTSSSVRALGAGGGCDSRQGQRGRAQRCAAAKHYLAAPVRRLADQPERLGGGLCAILRGDVGRRLALNRLEIRFGPGLHEESDHGRHVACRRDHQRRDA